MSKPIRLYQFPASGNCHRVRLFLSILGIPYEAISFDRNRNEHLSPEFLAKNPFGQVPVIEDGDVVLADSCAILVYLAKRYDRNGTWLPNDPVGAANVQRWLSVVCGEMNAGLVNMRRITVLGSDDNPVKARAICEKLFALIDVQLASDPFITGQLPTIADIGLYSYLALAEESNLSLNCFNNLKKWLTRIEQLPGFIPTLSAKNK